MVQFHYRRPGRRTYPVIWSNLILLDLVAVAGSSSHSFKIVSFAIWDPSQRLSYVIGLSYVDSQIIARYDSNSRKIQPQFSWIQKLAKDIPQYWQALTDEARTGDDQFRERLENLMIYYNMDKGLHMLQVFASCDLQGDGSKRGSMKMACNGRTIASSTMNVFLMENCIELLDKCLSYGKKTLLRTETPMVTLSSRTEMEDGMEMHICRVDGFYPREIDASWTRDGEFWLQDTLHGSVAPNADGTYHYWLSIQIDPKERGHYRCHVEHDGLQEPLDLALALKVPGSNLGLIIGCVAIGLVVVCVIVGTSIFLRNHRQGRGELQRTTSL